MDDDSPQGQMLDGLEDNSEELKKQIILKNQKTADFKRNSTNEILNLSSFRNSEEKATLGLEQAKQFGQQQIDQIS